MFQEKELHNGDLRESQVKRTQAEKVAASDIMVASLAHELKNGMRVSSTLFSIASIVLPKKTKELLRFWVLSGKQSGV